MAISTKPLLSRYELGKKLAYEILAQKNGSGNAGDWVDPNNSTCSTDSRAKTKERSIVASLFHQQ